MPLNTLGQNLHGHDRRNSPTPRLNRTVGGIDIDPTIKILWLTLGGYYRLGTWDLTDAPGENAPTVTVDAIAGARGTITIN